MITLSEVTMGFGAQLLFENVTWRMNPGRRYGLVGANGTGKSTLLKLLDGQLRAEKGVVSRPNDLRLGVLAQDQNRYDGMNLLDVVIQGKPHLAEALREKQEMLTRLEKTGEFTDEDGHRLGDLEGVIADHDGYTAESTAAALLEGLGLPLDRHAKPMRELSGGYRLRVLLARTLFQETDMLVLDEPTNHLDIVSIRWLEEFLRNYKGVLVVVSHDRHFLNGVCNEIADLDYQELRLYPGNYESFLEAKALAERQKESESTRAQKKIADTQAFIDRFKAKASKARQAGSRQKMIEKMADGLPTLKQSSRRFPKFQFKIIRPSGRDVLTLEQVSKSYGKVAVLKKISFVLTRGERLAVVGPNGVGKSTLLKIITGNLAPDEGKAESGYEVQTGYFGQDDQTNLEKRTKLADWLHAAQPGLDISTIRGTLGRVLFSGDEADKFTGSLSGGEAARLLLARLMLQKDNLLALDEPTNHLDLEGREALMHALQEYTGTLIFVSHDRHFVSHVADRVLALSPDGFEDFHGNYEEYLAKEGADYLDRTSSGQGPTRLNQAGDKNPSSGSVAGGDPAPKPSHHERKGAKRETERLTRLVKKLEEEISRLEQELVGLDVTLARPDYYTQTPREEITRKEAERKEAQTRLVRVMADWEQAGQELEKPPPG